jgi:hypothetical protein
LSRAPEPGGPQNPGGGAEIRAIVITIARLRRQLRRGGRLQHPDVQRGLRELERDVIVAMDLAGRPPGRHRAPERPPRVYDAAGIMSGVNPDPSLATTPAEFMLALRWFKVRSGATWRQVAAQSRNARVHSTIWTALHRDTLPTLDTVRAIINGCGGTAEDLVAFTAAWHRIANGISGGGFHAAPPAV